MASPQMLLEPITVDVYPAVFLERDYEFLGEVGSGQYGKVWKCRSRVSGRQYACKQIKKREATPAAKRAPQADGQEDSATGKSDGKNGGRCGGDYGDHSEGGTEPIEREIAALTHLAGCAGVTSLHGVFEDATSVFLLMDFCDSGDLFSVISDTEGVPEDEARQLFADVARAVKECHDRGVLHRDIKPDNVLLNKRAPQADVACTDDYHAPYSFTVSSGPAFPGFRGFPATSASRSSKPSRRYGVKLADFGLSVILTGEGRVRGYAGSFPYEAPEVVALRDYSFPADIWSMGVLLYALLSANWPEFKDRQALNEKTDWTGASWDQVSDDAKDLIRRLLTVDQDRRPTIDEVLRHPWLALLTGFDRSESVDSADCESKSVSEIVTGKSPRTLNPPQKLSLLVPPLLIPSQSLDSRESTSLESASSIPSEASFMSALAATPASLPTPTAAVTNRTRRFESSTNRKPPGWKNERSGKRSAQRNGEDSKTGGARGVRGEPGGSGGIRSNCASRGSSASETLPVSENSGVLLVTEGSCDYTEGWKPEGDGESSSPVKASESFVRTRKSQRQLSREFRMDSATEEEARGRVATEEQRRGVPSRRGSLREYAVQVVTSLRGSCGGSWQPGCFYSTAQTVAPEGGNCDETTTTAGDSPAASCVASPKDVPAVSGFGAPKRTDTEDARKNKDTADMDILRGIEAHLSAFFSTRNARKCA